MSLTNISISDFKVAVNLDGSITTYARDKYRASLDNEIIHIVNISSGERVLTFKDIRLIKNIVDYRGGDLIEILIPSNLKLLYTDIIEDIENPFFFEQSKVDSSGPVEVKGTVGIEGEVDANITNESINVEENPNGTTVDVLSCMLDELKEQTRLLNKIYK